MNNNLQNYMAINTEDGKIQEIMGKYMYYSLPKLIVKAERVKEICRQIGFPIEVNENISATDAFRSATGEIYDRIEETESGGVKTVKIYCRDNKRANTDVLSRELVEETLYETTNSYKKLANLSLDKTSGELILSDVDYSSARIYGDILTRRKTFFNYIKIVSETGALKQWRINIFPACMRLLYRQEVIIISFQKRICTELHCLKTLWSLLQRKICLLMQTSVTQSISA